MKLEFFYCKSYCSHCENEYQEIIFLLESYPYKNELILYDVFEIDYEKKYELASKYGFLSVPLIAINDQIVFREIPTKALLLKTLEEFKNQKKCPKPLEQEQIVLY